MNIKLLKHELRQNQIRLGYGVSQQKFVVNFSFIKIGYQLGLTGLHHVKYRNFL